MSDQHYWQLACIALVAFVWTGVALFVWLAPKIDRAIKRQRRNWIRSQRITTVPPRYGFRDCNGPVRMRGQV